jgi:hypothetical protein
LENLKGRDHSEDLGIDGKIILKWIFRIVGEGLDSSGSGLVAGSCEHGNEPSGFIKGREFLDKLSKLLASQDLCSVQLVRLQF